VIYLVLPVWVLLVILGVLLLEGILGVLCTQAVRRLSAYVERLATRVAELERQCGPPPVRRHPEGDTTATPE
jgi:hypothetical protein